MDESEPRDAGVSQPHAATPELRLLRVFVEVAEQLSFTRAAETLFLRQQTVSKMIRDLERDLGVELLERTTRQVHITPAGMMLLQEGRAILSSADAAFAATRAVGTGENPTTHVGATVAIGSTDQAEVARALRQGRPGLSVAFHEVALGNLGGAFTKDRLDVALTRTGGTTDGRFDRAELRPTSAVVCLPDTHPLASRREVRAAELDGERLLIPSPVGKPYADMLLAHFRAAGAVVSPVQAHTTGGPVLLIEVAVSKSWPSCQQAPSALPV